MWMMSALVGCSEMQMLLLRVCNKQTMLKCQIRATRRAAFPLSPQITLRTKPLRVVRVLSSILPVSLLIISVFILGWSHTIVLYATSLAVTRELWELIGGCVLPIGLTCVISAQKRLLNRATSCDTYRLTAATVSGRTRATCARKLSPTRRPCGNTSACTPARGHTSATSAWRRSSTRAT